MVGVGLGLGGGACDTGAGHQRAEQDLNGSGFAQGCLLVVPEGLHGRPFVTAASWGAPLHRKCSQAEMRVNPNMR
ncbi:Uncharacterised protein [Bordetella pertussis]|nr:Uncharacterised protein [Bordetella pertussis]